MNKLQLRFDISFKTMIRMQTDKLLGHPQQYENKNDDFENIINSMTKC